MNVVSVMFDDATGARHPPPPGSIRYCTVVENESAQTPSACTVGTVIALKNLCIAKPFAHTVLNLHYPPFSATCRLVVGGIIRSAFPVKLSISLESMHPSDFELLIYQSTNGHSFFVKCVCF